METPINRRFPFAWYQVTNNASLSGKASQNATFTASTETKNIGTLQFPISVAITPFGNSADDDSTTKPTDLEMVNYYLDGQSVLQQRFGYYVEGEASPRYQTTQFGDSPIWVVYKAVVTLSGATIEGVTYTPAEASHLLNVANEQFGLKVEADEGSRAKLYLEAVDDASTPTKGVAPSNVGETTQTLRAKATVEDGTTSWTYYFGMYIEGEGTNDGSTAPNGNFTVSFIS